MSRGWSYYQTTRRWSARPHGWWIAVYTGHHFGWKVSHEPRALFIDTPRLAIAILRPRVDE